MTPVTAPVDESLSLSSDSHRLLVISSACNSSSAASLRKPQRRLQRLPTDFSPPPIPHNYLSPDNTPPIATTAHSTDSASAFAIRSLPSTSSSFSSSSSSLPVASRSSHSSVLPSFRTVRRRCQHSPPPPTAAARRTKPHSQAAVVELLSDDDEVLEARQDKHYQLEREKEEERVEEAVSSSQPALAAQYGPLSPHLHFAVAAVNESRPTGRTVSCSRSNQGGGSGSGSKAVRCIDLTGRAAEDERTQTQPRKKPRQPLATLAHNTLSTRTGHNTPLPMDEESSGRARGGVDQERENGSALQYIQSVCDAVSAARREKQRKRRSQQRQQQQEVIEVMSEQSACDEDDDDEATVTHIIRQPTAPARPHSAQSSDRVPWSASPSRFSPPLPPPCVESVKNREARASLPGYACTDCHAFHSVAHGDRPELYEGFCRHRYSQSDRHKPRNSPQKRTSTHQAQLQLFVDRSPSADVS